MKKYLLWIGAFGLLILGILVNFFPMKWFVLIPIELVLMACVIIGLKK